MSKLQCLKAQVVTRSAWLLRVRGRTSRRRRPPQLDPIHEQLTRAMAQVAVAVQFDARTPWETVVTYIAVAQRVLARTSPEVLRDCAQFVELASLIPPEKS